MVVGPPSCVQKIYLFLNNDFKVSYFIYLPQKLKNIKKSDNITQKLILYPYPDVGEQINICCVSKAQI